MNPKKKKKKKKVQLWMSMVQRIILLNDKLYEAVVYIPNNEGTGINKLGMEDINLIIKNLITEHIGINGKTDGFYEDHPWEKKYNK